MIKLRKSVRNVRETNMNVEVHIQNAANAEIPDESEIQAWASASLQSAPPAHVTLRVVNISEMQQLNKQFRHKDKPTNVLSFPNAAPKDLSDGFIGDIVLCHDVIAEEAIAQDKDLQQHWAHMVIHSMLHLQGFDHQHPDEANIMEAKEIELLEQFGIPNPYIEVKHGK